MQISETPEYHAKCLSNIIVIYKNINVIVNIFCQTPVLGLGVDFTFAWDNNNNDNNDKNRHLNFLKVTKV